MRKNAALTAEMTVDEAMRRWSSTIRVFRDFRMRCVGCPVARFHSVDDAREEHDIDAEVFLQRLSGDREGGGLGTALASLNGFLAFCEAMKLVGVAQHDALPAAFDKAAVLPGAEDAADGM